MGIIRPKSPNEKQKLLELKYEKKWVMKFLGEETKDNLREGKQLKFPDCTMENNLVKMEFLMVHIQYS